MTDNMLQHLSDLVVPPPPEDLDQHVHQRLNFWLLGWHLLDLALRGLPFALIHFSRSLTACLFFTLSGKFQLDENKGERHGQ